MLGLGLAPRLWICCLRGKRLTKAAWWHHACRVSYEEYPSQAWSARKKTELSLKVIYWKKNVVEQQGVCDWKESICSVHYYNRRVHTSCYVSARESWFVCVISCWVCDCDVAFFCNNDYSPGPNPAGVLISPIKWEAAPCGVIVITNAQTTQIPLIYTRDKACIDLVVMCACVCPSVWPSLLVAMTQPLSPVHLRRADWGNFSLCGETEREIS